MNINIVGEAQPHPFEKVKDAVVKRAGKYYWRHDTENLLYVTNHENKKFIYRKESSLITITLDDGYRLKSECVKVGKDWIWKYSAYAVKVGNTITHKNFTVVIGNTRYLLSDPNIIIDPYTSQAVLKSDAILLDTEYYNSEIWVSKANTHIKLINGKYYHTRDLVHLFTVDKDGNKVAEFVPQAILKYPVRECWFDFKEPHNPQYGKYLYLSAKDTDVVYKEAFGFAFHKDTMEKDIALITKVKKEAEIRDIDRVKSILDQNFDDAGPDENCPKKWNKDYARKGGKQRIYSNVKNFKNIKSDTFDFTGGIDYGFGVEIETSAGVVSQEDLKGFSLDVVGDGSIGSAEYVTPVLCGNNGIEYLKKVCDLIAESCMVDKRCGVHVHVGNFPGGTSKVPIDFNRTFAEAAIKLGCTIEDELYSIMPPSRTPTWYQCHGIKRYSGVNSKNILSYLGTYLFGEREDRVIAKGLTDSFPILYGSNGYNKETSMGPWVEGRYKWLNLIRAYTKCSSPTIEFRIFSGSTNFEKIYNYVLISLAFTKICNLKYGDVVNSRFTLKSMLEEAYKDHPDIYYNLLSWIELRQAKFGKKVNS